MELTGASRMGRPCDRSPNAKTASKPGTTRVFPGSDACFFIVCACPGFACLRQYRTIRRRHLWRILRIRQPCQINELARLVASDPGTLRVPVRACLQKSRFTPSKPSIFAIASCTKFIHICTTSFARYCLYFRLIMSEASAIIEADSKSAEGGAFAGFPAPHQSGKNGIKAIPRK